MTCKQDRTAKLDVGSWFTFMSGHHFAYARMTARNFPAVVGEMLVYSFTLEGALWRDCRIAKYTRFGGMIDART